MLSKSFGYGDKLWMSASFDFEGGKLYLWAQALISREERQEVPVKWSEKCKIKSKSGWAFQEGPRLPAAVRR